MRWGAPLAEGETSDKAGPGVASKSRDQAPATSEIGPGLNE